MGKPLRTLGCNPQQACLPDRAEAPTYRAGVAGGTGPLEEGAKDAASAAADREETSS